MKKIFAILLAVTAFASGADIRPNQNLQITIQGVPQSEGFRLNSIYVVSGGGTINMWEIGTVRAVGRTPSELAASLAASYKAKGIYTSPTFQIIVQGDERLAEKTITVGGFVGAPGPKPYRDNLTLFEAVTAAGGANAFGADNRVKLYRNARVYTYNLKNNDHKRIKIYPGDAIEVPEKNIWGK